MAARAPEGGKGGEDEEWRGVQGGGRIGTSSRRARDEEWRACSMISERCACGCDSSGRTVSARREDRSHARDTSAQGQAGRRGIVRSTHGLHGLLFLPGGGRGGLAQGRGPDGGFCCRWPICAPATGSVPYQRKSSAHSPSDADSCNVCMYVYVHVCMYVSHIQRQMANVKFRISRLMLYVLSVVQRKDVVQKISRHNTISTAILNCK